VNYGGLRPARSIFRMDCYRGRSSTLGRAAAHWPVALDLDLLGNFDRIIDLDAEVANRAFQAPVPQ
jgi:hypothetical protein